MSRVTKIFQQYVSAVDTLGGVFEGLEGRLHEGETSSQFQFNTPIESLDWVKDNLHGIAKTLLPARFDIWLIVTAYDLRVSLSLHRGATGLEVDVDGVEAVMIELPDRIPEKVIEAYEDFKANLQAGTSGVPISRVYELSDALTAAGASMKLNLKLFLDKNDTNRRLATAGSEGERLKVVSFLYPEVLVQSLQGASIDYFEKEFCEIGKRTIFPVFGFSGYLNSDLLVICGSGFEDKLDSAISEPLSSEEVQKNIVTLDFRQSQNLWAYPTSWVTPDTFSFSVDFAGEPRVTSELRLQLRSFQALLSAIFLADRVDHREGKYWVEYKGYGRVKIPLERRLLTDNESQLEALYRLYTYAYEGFSPDKLEIGQQFLSFLAEDVHTLLLKAADIQEATKKTYERALVDKVKEYFDARQKIRQHIKSVVTETSESVISLTREVSADLYKVAGIVAGAVISVLLKPDIILWASFFGSLAITGYLSLVIFYHLSTLRRAYDLNIDQHLAYIQSYDDILRTKEVQSYLSDEKLEKAKNLYSEKSTWAVRIYAVLLFIFLVVLVISIILLLL
jgi:hypothetical protein